MKIIHIEGAGQFVTVTKYPDPDVTEVVLIEK